MNQREAKQGLKLLGGRVERSAIMAVTGKRGCCLSVEWINGGSQVFYSVQSVKDWVESRKISEAGSVD